MEPFRTHTRNERLHLKPDAGGELMELVNLLISNFFAPTTNTCSEPSQVAQLHL